MTIIIPLAIATIFTLGFLIGYWARGDRVNQSGCIAGGDIIGGDAP